MSKKTFCINEFPGVVAMVVGEGWQFLVRSNTANDGDPNRDKGAYFANVWNDDVAPRKRFHVYAATPADALSGALARATLFVEVGFELTDAEVQQKMDANFPIDARKNSDQRYATGGLISDAEIEVILFGEPASEIVIPDRREPRTRRRFFEPKN